MKRALLFALACLAGCGRCSPYGPYEHEPPETPTPIADLNTPYDDYNAPAPYGPSMVFIWSTNRGSEGKQFDIWRSKLRARYKDQYRLEVVQTPEPWIASDANEFGPFFHDEDVVYASDRAGHLDLYFKGEPLAAINSPSNDAYWTWAQGHPSAYFASDRGGSGYDIYEIRPGPFQGEIRRVAELSSSADDSAPYLFRLDDAWQIIFASKREGGAGGYDLWTSRWIDGTWETPVALKVNSPSDEFRPSVSDRKLLIFSSNRPGGKGGFDLYYARFSR